MHRDAYLAFEFWICQWQTENMHRTTHDGLFVRFSAVGYESEEFRILSKDNCLFSDIKQMFVYAIFVA